jgi:nucleoside-specific outer membrane channel protein Tsx
MMRNRTLRNHLTFLKRLAIFALGSASLAQAALAADWSTTEAQFQYGNLKNPFAATGSDTSILTLQHASGWKYGDNFFFVDFLNDSDRDGFNDTDVYAEWYPNFSLGKISGCNVGGGALEDLGVVLGFNYSADANVQKFLPGMRFAWAIPGDGFLNTDVTAFMDFSEGDGAPREGDSFMVDFNGAFPFSIGEQDFSIEGHIEYIHGRSSSFGDVENWVLAQPQFRWDLGKALFSSPKQLFIGIEYQYWHNKLGTKTDESVAQALLVWRF